MHKRPRANGHGQGPRGRAGGLQCTYCLIHANNPPRHAAYYFLPPLPPEEEEAPEEDPLLPPLPEDDDEGALERPPPLGFPVVEGHPPPLPCPLLAGISVRSRPSCALWFLSLGKVGPFYNAPLLM